MFGTLFVVPTEQEVDNILMELSFEALDELDYENGTYYQGSSSVAVNAVFSDTLEGQDAIRRVAKELKIRYSEV